MPPAEQLVATTRIDAAPEDVFAFLCDPANHQRTEPTDWVRDPIDAAPIERVGQLFGMHMYLDLQGGEYEMYNRVAVFEPGRAIAWEPGFVASKGEDGGEGNADAAPDVRFGGWSWRYDIEPDGEADGAGPTSRVTLTYDWSAVPEAMRSELPSMPPFPVRYLEKSLGALAANF